MSCTRAVRAGTKAAACTRNTRNPQRSKKLFRAVPIGRTTKMTSFFTYQIHLKRTKQLVMPCRRSTAIASVSCSPQRTSVNSRLPPSGIKGNCTLIKFHFQLRKLNYLQQKSFPLTFSKASTDLCLVQVSQNIGPIQ